MMRKFIWAFLISSLLIGASAAAQDFVTVSGTVTDSLTGEPLSGVTITADPDGFSAITDTQGRYRISRLAPGQVSLLANSAFHHSKRSAPLACREGDLREIDFALTPLVLEGSAQQVRAAAERRAGIQGYDRTTLESSTARDVGSFLHEQGIYTQSDGRTKYATLRGASPEGVLVLLDGQPLNPDGGAVDLAQFPTATIERVDIYTTVAAARFGPNAHGGAIDLISRKVAAVNTSQAVLRAATGSYGDHQYELRWQGETRTGVLVAANFNYSESANDFNYEHPYLGELERRNNFARASSGWLSLKHAQLAPLTFSARYYNRTLGIPGAVLQETPAAGSDREGQIYSLDYATSNLNLHAGLRQLSQGFHSKDRFSRYQTHYLQMARELEGQWRHGIGEMLSLELGSRILSETFFADNLQYQISLLPTVSRRTQSLFGGANFSREVGRFGVTFDTRYRVDRLDDKTFTSPSLGVIAAWHSSFTLGLEAGYGESYRYPPIDALFWQESVFSLGNADLRPETAISREWGAHFDLETPLRIEARTIWFERDVVDQITWRPRFDGKYQPVNIGRVETSGNESSITLKQRDDHVSLRYSHTSQTSINKTAGDGYYNLWAPFLPDRIERLDFSIRVWRLRCSYAYSFTGKRFLREANTKWLPPHVLHDLTVELSLNLFAGEQTLRLELLNLADKQYELLERMPMPPRRVRLGLMATF